MHLVPREVLQKSPGDSDLSPCLYIMLGDHPLQKVCEEVFNLRTSPCGCPAQVLSESIVLLKVTRLTLLHKYLTFLQGCSARYHTSFFRISSAARMEISPYMLYLHPSQHDWLELRYRVNSWGSMCSGMGPIA